MSALQQYKNDVVRIRERLCDVRWRDAGHHCEAKSAVHAVLQMLDDIEKRIIPGLEESPARGAEVTDEMVERALVGYHGQAHWTTGLHPWEIDTYRKDMRAALLAALTPPAAKGKP